MHYRQLPPLQGDGHGLGQCGFGGHGLGQQGLGHGRGQGSQHGSHGSLQQPDSINAAASNVAINFESFITFLVGRFVNRSDSGLNLLFITEGKPKVKMF